MPIERARSLTTRTSVSHPLQIAKVHLSPDHGRIGITFCPGKKQAAAFTGSWDRDLDLDCDAIRDWGAAAVVTLVEGHELRSLKVQRLGDAVRSRGMAWYHLPIRDVSTPCGKFEQAWTEVGPELRRLVRDGKNVLVHCKGGLGRAGMIAARLLVELGMTPADAISAVRAVRPGAIETRSQVEHVLAARPIEDAPP
jgi:ADP-ribosyl-[dinitrogen reductase] hydrolase